MRILYLSDHGPYSSTFIKQDVEAMNNLHEVRYVCFSTDKEYERKNVITHLIEYPTYSIRSKVIWHLENMGIYSNWYNRDFSKALNKFIYEFKPDIIHCQFAYEGLKFFDNVKTDIPVVINFRGYDASYKLKKDCYVNKLKEILAHKNVYPIFVCKALRNNLENKGICIRKEHLILYTGVNTKLFRKKSYTLSKHPVFIQTGAFNDKKGQDISVKAFNKFLNESNVSQARLLFIGSGKNLNRVKNLVKELELDKNVQFIEKLPQNELVKHLDAASVFVHHSVTAPNGDMEGIPNAIIEAMAMKLPILASKHSGIPEAVIDGENGLLCEEGDVDTFAIQMQEIISFGFLSINEERVHKHFGIDSHITKLNHFYTVIVSNK